MELLRITAESKSLRSFVTPPICVIVSIACLIFSIVAWGEATAFSLIIGATGVVLGGISATMFRGLLSPFQWEFVIEPNQLRFGRAGRIESQRIFTRADIKCLIWDGPADPSLMVDTGRPIAPPLAPGLIHTWSQMESVIRTVQENWPEVPVFSLEQFQATCRKDRRTRRHP